MNILVSAPRMRESNVAVYSKAEFAYIFIDHDNSEAIPQLHKELKTGKHDVIISCSGIKGPGDIGARDLDQREFELLDSLAQACDSSKIILHFTAQFPGNARRNWFHDALPWTDAKGQS